MGEVHALHPRQPAPAAHKLSPDEMWSLLRTGLQAARVTLGQAVASIEDGAPSADTFALIGRLDTQLAPIGPLVLALHGSEHPAGAA